MTGRVFAALVGALVSLAFAAPAGAAARSCAHADALPGNVPADQARVATRCLLNGERARRGVRPLRPDTRLARAARRHARDMVRHRYFAHDSRDGREFSARIRAARYFAGARGWTVGENLAWGSRSAGTPRQIVAAWMASPPHRRNILNRRFAEIGVSVVRGGPVKAPGAATYVTEFGWRG